MTVLFVRHNIIAMTTLVLHLVCLSKVFQRTISCFQTSVGESVCKGKASFSNRQIFSGFLFPCFHHFITSASFPLESGCKGTHFFRFCKRIAKLFSGFLSGFSVSGCLSSDYRTKKFSVDRRRTRSRPESPPCYYSRAHAMRALARMLHRIQGNVPYVTSRPPDIHPSKIGIFYPSHPSHFRRRKEKASCTTRETST